MSTEQQTVTPIADILPAEVELRFGPSKMFRRVLIARWRRFAASPRPWISVSLYAVVAARGRFSRSLAYNSTHADDCYLLYPNAAQDDDVSFIVDGTHFGVTRKEAAQIAERFGLKSRVMDSD